MAKKLNHAWGLEIGQSAIKALRCHLEGDRVVADSFDFVEYPKILSQPDSDPEALLADALEQLMSRNDLRGCKVAVSVPGQQGLAKFFKPPPVEVKKIPDIVRYEAKQQIPFDLDDVIWDFQQMAGANVEDGYALESEVGLFAMKREAVYRALKPYQSVDVAPDIIQLSPVAIYNMIAYDRFANQLENDKYDPEKPPASTVLLAMGTDASDLIVTNGFRIWQRSIPIGGNHFTRQLSKELKLTFAKAEHVKRNAMQADDPKLVFQAMRPIFNDLQTEIQRSMGFFRQLNKKAQIESILLLGNTAKLPGLQAYLNKSLGIDVEVLEKFSRLEGSEVISSPSFKENQPSFAVSYGLCLQALNRGPIRTNLLPREIVVDRLINSKKPWMVAAAASLLLGLTINYAMVHASYKTVAPELWNEAESSVSSLQRTSQDLIAEDEKLQNQVTLLRAIGEEVSSNTDRRLIWLELLSFINKSLNRDPAKLSLTPEQLPYAAREDFHITAIDEKYLDDVSKYVTDTFKEKYAKETTARLQLLGIQPPDPNAKPESGAAALPADDLKVPGWVVKLEGYHYHNGKQGDERSQFVRRVLISFLEDGFIDLPGPDGAVVRFSAKEMGISYPILVNEVTTEKEKIGNPAFKPFLAELSASGASGGGAAGGYGGAGGGYGGATGGYGASNTPAASAATTTETKKVEMPKDENGNEIKPYYDVETAKFVVQFVWREKTLKQRLDWKLDPRFRPDVVPPKEINPAAPTEAPAESS